MSQKSAFSTCRLMLGWVALSISACGPPAPDLSESPAPVAAPEADVAEKPAFDYPGGWLGQNRCVDICGVTPESPVERPPAVVCFNPDDAECKAKTGDGDYDYLMLSQHWLPTMCLGLAAGYDSTVTHQAGATCVPEAPNRLTIHGLWPNYNAGFPQCCAGAEPLDPVQVEAWPTELKQRLQLMQPDPTTSEFAPAICEIFNHEWQKHGTCFADSGDVDADARLYFETGLELHDRLAEANGRIDSQSGQSMSRSDIEALYPKAAQILCDSRKPERLLEVHTCWSRELEMVDCAPTKGFGSLTACGESVVLPQWPASSGETNG